MSLALNVSNLATRVSTECKSLRTLINGNAADLSGLTTTAKTNLVAAVNELKAAIDALPEPETGAGIDDNVTGTTTTWSSSKISSELTEHVNAVLDGAPAALDTLNELAAAIGDDADFAGSVTASLAGKQPLDADLTAIAALPSAANKLPYATGAGTWSLADLSPFARQLLDDADAAAMRDTLSVYSRAEIGNPDTDFVATFESGLT